MLRSTLAEIDRHVDALRQRGHGAEALQVAFRCLNLHRDHLGACEATEKYVIRVAELVWRAAQAHVGQQHFDTATSLLGEALWLVESALQSDVLNYRLSMMHLRFLILLFTSRAKQHRWVSALEYASKAHSLARELNAVWEIPTILLSRCSILSATGRHLESLEDCRAGLHLAVHVLHSGFMLNDPSTLAALRLEHIDETWTSARWRDVYRTAHDTLLHSQPFRQTMQSILSRPPKGECERWAAVLALAHKAAAGEYEYLGLPSYPRYCIAWQLASLHLGVEHPITQQCRLSLEANAPRDTRSFLTLPELGEYLDVDLPTRQITQSRATTPAEPKPSEKKRKQTREADKTVWNPWFASDHPPPLHGHANATSTFVSSPPAVPSRVRTKQPIVQRRMSSPSTDVSSVPEVPLEDFIVLRNMFSLKHDVGYVSRKQSDKGVTEQVAFQRLNDQKSFAAEMCRSLSVD